MYNADKWEADSYQIKRKIWMVVSEMHQLHCGYPRGSHILIWIMIHVALSTGLLCLRSGSYISHFHRVFLFASSQNSKYYVINDLNQADNAGTQQQTHVATNITCGGRCKLILFYMKCSWMLVSWHSITEVFHALIVFVQRGASDTKEVYISNSGNQAVRYNGLMESQDNGKQNSFIWTTALFFMSKWSWLH